MIEFIEQLCLFRRMIRLTQTNLLPFWKVNNLLFILSNISSYYLSKMLFLPLIPLNKKSDNRKNDIFSHLNASQRGSHLALDPIQAKLKKMSSQKLRKCGILTSENNSLKEQVLEKVWLIRKIGDLLQQDTRIINDKRKKIKQNVSKNFKKYNKKADQLLNLIQEEVNFADERDFRKLRESLR